MVTDKEIVIKVRDVHKTYKKRRGGFTPALRGVSFDVFKGDLFCIVGPSGCGKSSLLRLLLGVIEPDQGQIAIDQSRRREGIAYVQQEAQMLPWRTLLQNAALGAEVTGAFDEDDVFRVRSSIEEYGLGKFESDYPTTLSGGEKQRVEIIRALDSNPSILLCDEPFSAIDFVSRLRISTLFKKMCKIRKITTLFVTHNIEEAIFLGDQIAVMSESPSRIVATHRPKKNQSFEDAVRCRGTEEFHKLFELIWEDLKG